MVNQRYPIEDIPSEDSVLRRIPIVLFDDDDLDVIPPSGFSAKNPSMERGLSVNWAKHRNARETKNQIGMKKPSEIEVVEISALDIRTAKHQTTEKLDLDVEHDPLPNEEELEVDNQAHSLILRIWNESKSLRHSAQQYLSMKSSRVSII